MNSLYRFAALCLFLGGSAVRAAPPKGVPNQSFPEEDVFTVIAEIPVYDKYWIDPEWEDMEGKVGSDPTISILVNEYVLVYSGQILTLFDLSDPYNPAFVHYRSFEKWIKNQGSLANPDNIGATTAYGGFHIVYMDSSKLNLLDYSTVDYADPKSPPVAGYGEVPRPFSSQECKDFGKPGGTPAPPYTIAYAWQPPYLYSAVRGVGIDITRVDDVDNITHVKRIDGWCEEHYPGNVFVVGNLLVFSAAEDKASQITTMDISDPENPVLLQHLTESEAKSARGLVNGNKFFTAGRDLEIWDISDPSNITLLRELAPSGGVSCAHGSHGGVDTQDGFVFFGASCNGLRKWNIETGELAGSIGMHKDEDDLEWDLDYFTVFGNIVVGSSEDEFQGTFIIPHQAEPDNTAPSVNMVVPKDGAVNQHVKSRVGFTFTDHIDLMSANTSTIQVMKEDGSVLPGKFATARSIVNFTPDQELEPNTSYAVCVPAGGVRDYAGNPTSESFVSYFSTGSSVEEFDCDCEGGTNVRLSGSRLRSEIGTRTRIMPVMDRDASRSIGGSARLYDMRGRSVSGSGEALRNLQKGVYISIGGSGR